MEIRFYKAYSTGHRLELCFLNNSLPPTMAKDMPEMQPSEEMNKDEDYFKNKAYNETLLEELEQRGFSKDV